jgi:hypothetical protein
MRMKKISGLPNDDSINTRKKLVSLVTEDEDEEKSVNVIRCQPDTMRPRRRNQLITETSSESVG